MRARSAGLAGSHQFPFERWFRDAKPGSRFQEAPLIRRARIAAGLKDWQPARGYGCETVWAALFRRFGCAPGQPRALFVPHFIEAQTCADGDDVQNRVRRIGGQAQPVKFLPHPDADVRGIAVRMLSLQVLAALLHAFSLLQRDARAMRLDELRRAGTRCSFGGHEP